MGRFNDKIPNINLLDTKVPQIHGHTKIELYNPKTKIKNVTESDNTFQPQFAQKIMASLGQFQDSNNSNTSSDVFTIPSLNLFGGLMLFRDTIPVGSQYMPKTNKMVGLGYRDKTNGIYPNSLGSFNAVESSASVNGMTMVYDFATNQSNGQIGCVCLTHKQGALIGGYGYPDIDRPASISGRYDLHPSSTNIYVKRNAFSSRAYDNCTVVDNVIYSFRKVSDTVIRLYKQNIWIKQASLKSGYQETKDFDVSSDVSQYGIKFDNGDYMGGYVGNGKIIFAGLYTGNYWSANIPNGGRIYWYEYDIANDTLTLKSVVNATGGALDGSYRFFGGQNDLWMRNASNYTPWYIIDTESGVVIKQINNTYSSSGYIESADLFIGDRTLVCTNILPTTGGAGIGTYGYWIYNRDADSLLPLNLGSYQYMEHLLSSDNDTIVNLGEDYIKGDVNPLMLLTINNLNSPVTKTAAQTMKITYTLTES